MGGVVEVVCCDVIGDVWFIELGMFVGCLCWMFMICFFVLWE